MNKITEFIKAHWKVILIVLLSIMFVSKCTSSNNYERKYKKQVTYTEHALDSLSNVYANSAKYIDSLKHVIELNDIDYLKQAKLYNIFEYAKDLPSDEIEKINKYVNQNIPLDINSYRLIICDDKRIGCLLLKEKDDGVLLDEIYLEDNFRNKGIGTSIINNVLENNNIVYLWVYKDNIKAVNLYKRLLFNVIDETNTRYYMKYSK